MERYTFEMIDNRLRAQRRTNQRAIARVGRRFAVAIHSDAHGNWAVNDLVGGFGYARTPDEAAAQCKRPETFTLRQIAREYDIE